MEQLTKKESEVLLMVVKTELDELPDLINISDDKDKKELIEYQKVVSSIYNKLQNRII